jgi:hypothetical protein
MYGARCIAVALDSGEGLVALGAELQRLLPDDVALPDARTDSLGLGSIVYWPHLDDVSMIDEDDGDDGEGDHDAD